mmetsp:Transcript_15093/g.32712  ORF Transcript_15093/g.32712 Transcript_15093/m.32712 type:complete len:483 (+) Transcript_15093:99-1547(+)
MTTGQNNAGLGHMSSMKKDETADTSLREHYHVRTNPAALDLTPQPSPPALVDGGDLGKDEFRDPPPSLGRRIADTWLSLHLELRVLLCFLVVFPIMLIAILPWYLSYLKEGDTSEILAQSPPVELLEPDHKFTYDGIVAHVRVQSLTFPNPTASILIEFESCGAYNLFNETGTAYDDDRLRLNSTKYSAVQLAVDGRKWRQKLVNGQDMPSPVLSWVLEQEVPYERFPFDRYSLTISVMGSLLLPSDASSPGGDKLFPTTGSGAQMQPPPPSAPPSPPPAPPLTEQQTTDWLTVTLLARLLQLADPGDDGMTPDSRAYTPAPLAVIMDNSLMSFRVAATVTPILGSAFTNEEEETTGGLINGTTFYYVHITIQRSSTNIYFSIFVVIVMWALSIALFVWAIDAALLRPRDRLEATAASVCTAALFALPNVRNVQPGVPPIGAGIDIWGFFLNMTLVAVADVLMVFRLIVQHKGTAAAGKKKQ